MFLQHYLHSVNSQPPHHHGDNDYYRGGPAYFWEVYERNPLSGAILQVLTEHLDAGMVLCKGQFATSNDFSAAQ